MIGMNGEGLYFEIGKVYECSGTGKVTISADKGVA